MIFQKNRQQPPRGSAVVKDALLVCLCVGRRRDVVVVVVVDDSTHARAHSANHRCKTRFLRFFIQGTFFDVFLILPTFFIFKNVH